MSTDENLHALLRRTHEEKVLQLLRVRGPLSRAEIGQGTGISRTALSGIAATLLHRGLIVVATGDSGPAGRGRPAERLALNPSAGQLMGVDLGHERVLVVIVDTSHTVVASAARSYDRSTTWEERLGIAFEVVESLATDDLVDLRGLAGVGVGLAGPFSAVSSAPRASDQGGESLSVRQTVLEAFTERFGAPVVLDNNTRFAALAEAIWGGRSDADDLVYARLSHGVGGGLVVGGRLIRGATGFAGEIGHVSVRQQGARCRCGKRGCLETIASVPAVLARCAEEGVELADLDALAEAAAAGDPVVDQVLRDAGSALGQVLGTLAVTLNPSEIVVGGELVHRAPSLLSQAETVIRWELLPVPEVNPTIRAATLGDDDGARGAVAALLHSSPLLSNYPSTEAAPDDQAEREVS